MGPNKLWPDHQPDSFVYERNLRSKGFKLIAGLDEVGRGPLAGPVVAACVVLPPACDHRIFVDSKTISHSERIRLNSELKRIGALVGIGIVDERDIDRFNILQASLLAMKQAMKSLAPQPDFLLVDGKHRVPVSIPQQTMIKGETKSSSIAAASIAAKVYRDALMEEYHLQFPEYRFHRNKGYPTAEHRAAIKKCGPCEIHRRSFKGVREYCTNVPSSKTFKDNINNCLFPKSFPLS